MQSAKALLKSVLIHSHLPHYDFNLFINFTQLIYNSVFNYFSETILIVLKYPPIYHEGASGLLIALWKASLPGYMFMDILSFNSWSKSAFIL